MGRGGGKGRARLGLSYDVTGWHGGEGRGGGGVGGSEVTNGITESKIHMKAS